MTRIHGGIADNVVPARAERDAQLPLPARQNAEEAEPRAARLLAGRRERRARSATRRPRRVVVDTPLAERLREPAASRSSRSRRGLPWPSSPRAASTRSTSAPARPASRTRRRAGRGGRARADLRRAPALRPGSVQACSSPPCSRRRRLPVRPARRGAAARRRARDRAVDFGMGDPSEPTDPVIREALVAALHQRRATRARRACPELREAIAAWAGAPLRRRARPGREVIPTLGCKEAIFSLAQVVLDAAAARHGRRYTEPGVSGLRARRAVRGREPVSAAAARGARLPPRSRRARRSVLARAVFWVNYPNNPTGALAPLAFYERLAELARRADFVLASDEAYTELWFDEPPASALQVADRTNVLAFNTLSKRSSMTGYRSGFAAGDPQLIEAMKAFRPSVGTAPQDFVQRASIAAWDDEEHVERDARRYRRKRDVSSPVRAEGVRVAASEATMYLWSPSRTARARRRSRRGCSSTASSSPRLVLRPGRRGLLHGSRSSRRWRSAAAPPRSSRGAVTDERVEELDRRARPRRAARGGAGATASGSSTPRRRRRSSSTSGCARWSRSRSGRSSSTTRSR